MAATCVPNITPLFHRSRRLFDVRVASMLVATLFVPHHVVASSCIIAQVLGDWNAGDGIFWSSSPSSDLAHSVAAAGGTSQSRVL